MKTWQPHLLLIRESITSIEQYRPSSDVEFYRQVMAQDAILMRLQTIGENLAHMRRIDEDAFAELGDDSWHQLIGLRNIISHGYHHIRPEQIWQIITDELPHFAASIAVLREE